jgi:hypothetical protein
MRHLLTVALVAATCVASAQSPARIQWTRAARGPRGPEVVERWVQAHVDDEGRVHVRITDAADASLFETVVPGPRWRSSVGEECTAMGVASADLVRVRGRIVVLLEVSVGDLCERGALRFGALRTPLRAP